ncbi:MAG: hypothetical protein NTZ37_08690 [Methanoregula sp.]|nr:hypothetical protein [Methanoregula sp.]
MTEPTSSTRSIVDIKDITARAGARVIWIQSNDLIHRGCKMGK